MKSTTCTNTDDDWKTLFKVPNSTHIDFRSFFLPRGWQQVPESAMIARGGAE